MTAMTTEIKGRQECKIRCFIRFSDPERACKVTEHERQMISYTIVSAFFFQDIPFPFIVRRPRLDRAPEAPIPLIFMNRNPLLDVAKAIAITVALFCCSAAMADVVINEIKADSSDRLLRYHENGNQSVGPGTPWWAPGFDDSDWQTGALPAGRSSSVVTDLSEALDERATTLYTRKTFTASAAAAAATALTLDANYNDGIIVWLNGTEVARSNMGPQHGHFYFDQGAYRTGSSSTSEFEEFDISDFAAALVEGENVIAIQLGNIRSIEDRLPSGPPTTTTWIDFSLTAGEEELVAAGSEVSLRPGFAEPSGGVADFGALIDPEIEPGFSDWIELHNNGATAVDLSGWTLTDEVSVTDKWTFPQGTMIDAGGYLVVLADSLAKVVPTADYLHANFNLSSGGEYLGLYNSAGEVQSAFDPDYPSQDAFYSYGRNATGEFLFMDNPTPGSANSGGMYVDRVDAPDFDNPGGFYDAAVTVTLTSETEGAAIRYTTDGTDPTETNGMDYTTPLTLEQVSDDEGHVIRARAFLAGHIPSRIKTNTYLIQQEEGLTTAPALIYSGDVERTLYKPHGVLSVEGGTGLGSNWSARRSTDYNNIINRGRAYERKIHGEFYFPNGEVGFRTDMGVRAAASNWSRPRMTLRNVTRSPWAANANEKPSFNLYFRNDYGNPSVTLPLNGDTAAVDTFEKFRVRAGKNDISNPFAVDELVRRLHHDMGSVATRGVLNSLYVNAELKGYYNMVERLRSPFFGDHHGQTPGASWDVLAYAYDVNENVAEGSKDAWDEMITRLEEDPTPENWEKVLEVADVQAIADYYLINIYTAMWDWPHNNWVAARERSENGRYRLYVWDAEGGFANAGDSSATKNLIDGSLDSGRGELQVLWQRLKRWPQYRLLFADRVNKHMFNGGALDDRDWDNSHLKKRTDELVEEFAELQLAVSNQRLSLESLIERWTRSTGRRANLLGPRRDNLARNDLWPDTTPPEFSQFGGSVPDGFGLRITNEIGTVYYTTNGEDPRSVSGEPNPNAGSLAGSKLQVTIMEKGSSWKFDDSGVDLGTAWRASDYDDSAWGSGATPIGYGGISGTDIVTEANTDRNNTTYLRSTFEIDDATAILSLEAEVQVDSACVVYINGEEAMRDGFADGEEVNFDSRPSSDGNEGDFDTFEISPALLRTGTNVIALDVKNQSQSGGSSDMVIDFSLSATRTNPDSSAIPIAGPTTVKARSLNDGEWSALTEASFTVNTVPATSSNIAVAELLYNPVGPSEAETAAGFTDGDQFEFLEISNIGLQNVDLQGVRFTDGIAFDFSTSAIRSVAPGQHAIIVSDLAAFQQRYGHAFDSMIAGQFVGNLNNGGENVRLTGADDQPMHEFAYSDSEPWPTKADSGYSLQIVDTSGDHAVAANWKVSEALGGTPGPEGGAPALTLTQWQASFFSEEELQNAALSGPDADADGDMMTNFAEFVFGTSPRDGTDRPSSPRGGLMEDKNGNRFVTVTYTTAAEQRAVNTTGESSTDLAGWTATQVERVGQNALGNGRVEITFRDMSPVSPGEDRYLRLRMSAQ